MPTTIWYPAGGRPGDPPAANAPVAPGRYPLALFSHGLPGLPLDYAPLLRQLAAAGFVIAAPAYPGTNRHAALPSMADVPNQPADALFVIHVVLTLDTRLTDPFSGHLDTARYAAIGHSAGGFTTAGILATPHDHRPVPAVIIAGGLLGPVQPPPGEVLFIHGENDPVISYRDGRAAYDLLPWPKSLLTVEHGDHLGYLTPGRPGFDPVLATVTDFLRWTLRGDTAARARIPADGSADGVRFEELW